MRTFFKDDEHPITYDPTTDMLECVGFCDLCPANDPQHKTFEDCKNYFARATATLDKLESLKKIIKKREHKIIIKTDMFSITYNSKKDELKCTGNCDVCPAGNINMTQKQCKNRIAQIANAIEKLESITK